MQTLHPIPERRKEFFLKKFRTLIYGSSGRIFIAYAWQIYLNSKALHALYVPMPHAVLYHLMKTSKDVFELYVYVSKVPRIKNAATAHCKC
jgi:hypothetical protein